MYEQEYVQNTKTLFDQKYFDFSLTRVGDSYFLNLTLDSTQHHIENISEEEAITFHKLLRLILTKNMEEQFIAHMRKSIGVDEHWPSLFDGYI